jgi:hypothetical protein
MIMNLRSAFSGSTLLTSARPVLEDADGRLPPRFQQRKKESNCSTKCEVFENWVSSKDDRLSNAAEYTRPIRKDSAMRIVTPGGIAVRDGP